MNVYLIWEEGTSKYKIGKANEPGGRKSTFQTGNSSLLKIIGVYPTPDAERKEKYFQHKYHKFHHRGEWYNFPPQVIPEVLADFSVAGDDVYDTPLYKLWGEKEYITQKAVETMKMATDTLSEVCEAWEVVAVLKQCIAEYALLNPVITEEDFENFVIYEKAATLTAFAIMNEETFDKYIKPKTDYRTHAYV